MSSGNSVDLEVIGLIIGTGNRMFVGNHRYLLREIGC